MEFVRAVKRPFLDIKKLVIGILLSLVPIVDFIALGYELRSAKSIVAKKPKYDLPEWNDWGDLFVKGVLAIVIGMLYLLLPMIVLVALLGSSISDVESMSSLSGMAVVSVLVSYFMFGAVINFVIKDKFRAAFEFKEIWKRVTTGKYFLAWLVAVVYVIAVSSLLSFVPYVGVAVASFITGITAITLVAEAF